MSGFIGFGSRSRRAGGSAGGPSGSNPLSATSAAVIDDANLPSSYSLALKKLSKKADTTKLKGLAELRALLSGDVTEDLTGGDLPPPDEVIDFLVPAWATVYARLHVSPARQVREGANLTLAAIAGVAGNRMAPSLKYLIGPWLCSRNDPSREVAASATAAFEVAFPTPAKHPGVLAFCRGAIMTHIETNCLAALKDLTGLPMREREEIDAHNALVVSSSLGALALFIEVATGPNEGGNDGEANIEGVAETLETIDVWRSFGTHSASVVRRGVYRLVRAILSSSLDEILEAHLETVSHLILKAVGDKDSATHEQLWPAVLVFLSRHGPAVWGTLDGKTCREVAHRLFASLRKAYYGSGEASFPALLPLVAQIPPAVLAEMGNGDGGNGNRGQGAFADALLASLWKGRWEVDRFDHRIVKALLAAHAECALYLIRPLRDDEGGEENASAWAERAGRLCDARLSGQAIDLLTDGRRFCTDGAAATHLAALIEGLAAVRGPESGASSGLGLPFWPALRLAISDMLGSDGGVAPGASGGGGGDGDDEDDGPADADTIKARLADVVDQLIENSAWEGSQAQAAMRGVVAPILEQSLASAASSPSDARLLGTLSAAFGLADLGGGGSRSTDSVAASLLSSPLPGTTVSASTSYSPSRRAGGSRQPDSAFSALCTVLASERTSAGDDFWPPLVASLSDSHASGGDGQLRLAAILGELRRGAKGDGAGEAEAVAVWRCQPLDAMVEACADGLLAGDGNLDGLALIEAATGVNAGRRDAEGSFLGGDTAVEMLSRVLSVVEAEVADPGSVAPRVQAFALRVGRALVSPGVLPPAKAFLRTNLLSSAFDFAFVPVLFGSDEEGESSDDDEGDGNSPLDGGSGVTAAGQALWAIQATLDVPIRRKLARSIFDRLTAALMAGSAPRHNDAATIADQIMSLAGVFADDDEARAAFLADVAATLVAALLGPTKRDIRVAACGWRVGSGRLLVFGDAGALVGDGSGDPGADLAPRLLAIQTCLAVSTRVGLPTFLSLLGGEAVPGFVDLIFWSQTLADLGLVDTNHEGALVAFAPTAEALVASAIPNHLAACARRANNVEDPEAGFVSRVLECAVDRVREHGTLYGDVLTAVARAVQAASGMPDALAALVDARLGLSIGAGATEGDFVVSKTRVGLLIGLNSLAAAVSEAVEPLLFALEPAEGGADAPGLQRMALVMDVLSLVFGIEDPGLKSLGLSAVTRLATLVDAFDGAGFWNSERRTTAETAFLTSLVVLTHRLCAWLGEELRRTNPDAVAWVGNVLVSTTAGDAWKTSSQVNASGWTMISPVVTTGLRAFRALVSRLNLSADGASSVLYASAIGLVFDWGNALTEARANGSAVALLQVAKALLRRAPPSVVTDVTSLVDVLPLMRAWCTEVQVAGTMLAETCILAGQARSSNAAASGNNGSSSSSSSAAAAAASSEATTEADLLAEFARVEERINQLFPVAFRELLDWSEVSALTSADDMEEFVVREAHFSYLLAWRTYLTYYTVGDAVLTADLNAYLRQSDMLSVLLPYIFDLIMIAPEVDPTYVLEIDLFGIDPDSVETLALFASHIFYLLVSRIPKETRQWWTDAPRALKATVEQFTARTITPLLLEQEFALVQNNELINQANFSASASLPVREVTASYKRDDIELSFTVKFPEAFPLHVVDLAGGGKHVGVPEAQYRRWMLSFTGMLLNQDGNVVTLLLHWKDNIDKKFEGVDECTICYSVFHISNYSLPTMQCQTCRNKFHGACLYRWFTSSGGSTCPLCRQPF